MRSVLILAALPALAILAAWARWRRDRAWLRQANGC